MVLGNIPNNRENIVTADNLSETSRNHTERFERELETENTRPEKRFKGKISESRIKGVTAVK